MKPALKIVLAAVLASALGCGSDGPSGPDGDTVPARSVARLQWDGPKPANYLGGLDLPVDVLAFDAEGKGVPGVKIQFTADAGSGSFRGNGEAVTDSTGRAHGEWTMGIAGGAQGATAQVVGGNVSVRIPLDNVRAGAAEPPRFAADTVRLAGVLCTTTQEITGSSPSAFAGFGGLEPGVLLGLPTMLSGGLAWKYTRFMSASAGAARMVARDVYGRADTLVVVTGPEKGRVSLPDTIRVAAGDSIRVKPTYGAACADFTYDDYVRSYARADTTRFTMQTQASAVATAGRVAEGLTLDIWTRGLRAGETRLVVNFWGGADTALVVVR